MREMSKHVCMDQENELYIKNKNFLTSQNPSFEKTHSISYEIAKEKANSSQLKAEWEYWRNSINAIHLPNQILRKQETVEWVREQLKTIDISIDIEKYINKQVDVHLWTLSLKLREILEKMEIDPMKTVTVLGSGGTAIIALGTGSGMLLQNMIMECKPYAVHILLTDWNDLYSSFFHIDWEELTNYMERKNITFSFTGVSSPEEMLWKIRSQGLFYLDHACIYSSPSTDNSLIKYAEELEGNIVKNFIRYLGYTLDEYNMIIQAADTISREPLVYENPNLSIPGKFIVCGSGPSLDKSIEQLKILEKDHIIVCGGSSYKALVEAGIRVDFLTLMERDYDIGNDDYAGFNKQIGGAPKSTHLVMAAECYNKMLDAFPKHCIFFRSSLTSATIYANNLRQVINHEGPEAVNAAMSFSLQMGADKIILIGVDLGSIDKDETRSKKVLGSSDREFNITRDGNLTKNAYTCESMLNVKQVLEVSAKTYAVRNNGKENGLINCGEGIKIEGFQGLTITEYVKQNTLDKDSRKKSLEVKKEIDRWWNSLKVYSKANFEAQWKLRNPRVNTFKLCRKFEDLLKKPIPWFPEFQKECEEIFELDKATPEEQIPMRIMRGTIMKGVLGITQQVHILRNEHPEKIETFIKHGKEVLYDTLMEMENEIYQVLDYVERTRRQNDNDSGKEQKLLRKNISRRGK